MFAIFVYIYVLTTIEVSAELCNNGQQCASCDGNGWCESKCYVGYYGIRCNLKCSTGCMNNICHFNNNSGTEKCTKGCKPGFYGTRCSIPCAPYVNTCSKCPQECEGGFCQLESSCAQGCQDSYYGTACRSCPAWCEVCNRVSGSCGVCLHCEGDCTHGCLEGCTTGYFGDFCENTCNSGCLSGCDQISGDCFECKSGWFGGTCDKCPDSCVDEECDTDGICTRGCKVGWFGPGCDSKCGTECLERTCDRYGTCISGCKLGFHGKQCQNQCPATCINNLCDVENGSCQSCEKGFYGSHCNKSCVRCVDGSCKQDTGHCIKGCLSNYRGEFCQHDCGRNCTTDECHDICKINNEAKVPQYWIAGVSLIFIIFLVILVYVTYHFKRIDNDLYNEAVWQAQTETRDIEQGDMRRCNTSSSLHTGSEQESDCSQVGVQVVVLKQVDAESENELSLEDNVLGDKGVADNEHLKEIIVEKHLASDSFNVRKLEIPEKACEPMISVNTFILGDDETHIIMKEDSECDNIVDDRKILKDDVDKSALSRGRNSLDGKSKLMMILEEDSEGDNDDDERRMLLVSEEEASAYCDNGLDEGEDHPIMDYILAFYNDVDDREHLKIEGQKNIYFSKNLSNERDGISNTEVEAKEVQTFKEPMNKKSQPDMDRVDDQHKTNHYVEVFLMRNNSETMPVQM